MTDAFPVTVFHNPACGTSRNVVAMVEAAGYRPEVVEYLKAGWTADQLAALFAEAGLTPREAMRGKGTPAAELGLLDPDVSDAAILAAMVEHPVLV
ncbi:MAG: arsenate reductase family protein, partial [Alphaproteobacteria bacterium]|nr:arsenate reductase family protein [Alphaproteobacteria bacterium]MBU4137788.1 arsenate reductase family protein [Alphaproteobacteria bacterium]